MLVAVRRFHHLFAFCEELRDEGGFFQLLSSGMLYRICALHLRLLSLCNYESGYIKLHRFTLEGIHYRIDHYLDIASDPIFLLDFR